jgi:arginyl-tRNA synthetase
MLYTYARIQSVLRKAGAPLRDGIAWGALKTSQEKEIIQLLDRFEDELIQAGTTYNPGHLCNYLWSLAKSFNTFYHDSKIIHAENSELSLARIALADAVSRVIKIGLGLLGIEPTEQM